MDEALVSAEGAGRLLHGPARLASSPAIDSSVVFTPQSSRQKFACARKLSDSGFKTTVSYYVAEEWGAYIEKKNTRLCKKCQCFFDHWEHTVTKLASSPPSRYTEQVQLQPTVELLEISSQSGCPSCTLVVQAISAKFADQYDQSNEVTLFPERNAVGWSIRFKVGKLYGNRAVDIRLGVPLDAENLPSPRLRGTSKGNAASMEKARKWYDTCKNHHSHCVEQTKRALPTRLLHFKNGYLRLCCGRNLDINTRYASLSHCWGNLNMFCLTKERIAIFYTTIPITTLCQTFKDALHVLVALGLQYLWIDSLCIIQDDEEDWKRETLLMSTVYGSSDVNIAASSSKDGSQGCFRERQMPFRRLLQIHITGLQNTKTHDLSPYKPPGWEPSIQSLPLSRRAWAYQERRLSPRVLFFTNSQLYWQCSTWDGEKWKDEDGDSIRGRIALKYSPELINFWNDSIREYSSCDLTFARDKLVAISGIAKRRQQAVPGNYFAGIWEKDFEHQLCWRCEAAQKPKSDVYQAPSWSWASTSSSIQPGENYQDEEAVLLQVLDVKVALETSDPMGALSRGVLKLECIGLLPGIIGNRGQLLMKSGCHFIKRWATFDYRSDMVVPYYLLPVRKDDSGEVEGLIVKPTYKSTGEYKRIGFFYRPHWARFKRTINSRSGSSSTALPLECFHYSKEERSLLYTSCESGKGPYVITIV